MIMMVDVDDDTYCWWNDSHLRLRRAAAATTVRYKAPHWCNASLKRLQVNKIVYV